MESDSLPVNELSSILGEFRSGGPELAEAVLATVVHVSGSAYRRPGARMLILPGSRRVGTISGGCLEGDVVRKAPWWTSGTGTSLRVFDNTTEDAAWEFGLGCNGVITILLERVANPGVPEVLRFLDSSQARREAAVVATVIRPGAAPGVEAGDRLLCLAKGAVGGSLWGSPLESALAGVVRAVFRERGHRLAHLGSTDVFVEWVPPPQRLVVIGAGHDVMPLVTMAAVLGWEVTVADRPSAYVQPRRFPGAQRVLALPDPGNLEALEIDSETAVVVMTHNYPLDRLLLPALLVQRPRYLGMLGPRTRAERLFREIGEDIEPWDVHAPVGLDIGSDHPETVALAILSEIQSVLAGRSGGSLRDREGPIHGAAREWGTASSRSGADLGETVLASCETRAIVRHA